MQYRIISIFSVFVFLLSPALAEDFPIGYFNKLDKPHYLVGGVYAFEYEENSVRGLGRVRSAYLPNGILVYPLELGRDDRPKNLLSKQRFSTYITQFGQVVIVKNSEVSEVPFSTRHGNSDVIFHQESFVCSSKNTPDCDEDEGISVSKSWIASSDRDSANRLVTLNFNLDLLNTNRTGHLSFKGFDALKRKGIISDLQEPWPRYAFIGKRELLSARKPCGVVEKEVQADEVKLSGGADIEFGVIDWLKLKFGAIFERSTSNEQIKVIGEADIELRLFELRIVKPDDQGHFDANQVKSLFITARFECAESGITRQAFNFRDMVVRNPNRDIPGRNQVTLHWSDFYRTELDKRDAEYIWDKNRQRAFAFSVNSSVDYDEIVRKIQTNTEFDIAISNILFSAFNASCDSRGGARDKCEAFLR